MDLMYACPHCHRVFDTAGAREHNLLVGNTPVCQMPLAADDCKPGASASHFPLDNPLTP